MQKLAFVQCVLGSSTYGSCVEFATKKEGYDCCYAVN